MRTEPDSDGRSPSVQVNGGVSTPSHPSTAMRNPSGASQHLSTPGCHVTPRASLPFDAPGGDSSASGAQSESSTATSSSASKWVVSRSRGAMDLHELDAGLPKRIKRKQLQEAFHDLPTPKRKQHCMF